MPTAKNKDIQKLLSNKLNEKIQELELVKAHSDAVFSSIGEGAIVTDENGRIVNINQAALDMLGFKPEDVVGAWFPQVIKAKDMGGQEVLPLERPISQTFLDGKAVTANLFYVRKDKSTFPVIVTVSPIVLRGRPIGAIEVFRDISSDFHMNKMKDDFISIASHQLRTPASGVKQYIGMMLEGYAGKLTRQQLGMLRKAYASNERQLKIIDDLLRVAKIEAGKITLDRQPVDVLALVEDIMKELNQKFIQAKQTVRLSSSHKKITARIDRDRMRMAIENLLDNASKYTPEGGEINIDVQTGRGKLIIKISDSGIGISPNDRKRLFQKFMRLGHPSVHAVSGSGLGLYWAKQIVDLHEGEIQVRSELGKGSEFIIKIPEHA